MPDETQQAIDRANVQPSWLYHVGPMGTAVTSVLAVLGMLGLVQPAGAQLSGVPAWPRGVPNPLYDGAVYLTAHTTSGEDFLGDTKAETGLTLGGRWSVVPRLAVSGGLGFARRDVGAGERAERLHYFISAAATPLWARHPVEPIEFAVSVESGLGVTSLPGPLEERNIPAAVNASLSLGMGGWFIEPWIEPRWHWRRMSQAVGATWQDGFGGTVGVGLVWTTWSLLIAGDYLDLGATNGADSLPRTRVVAGSVGLQYAF